MSTTLILGSFEAATAAMPMMKMWKGRLISITLKDGAIVTDVLATVRDLRAYLSDGRDVDLLEAKEASLKD